MFGVEYAGLPEVRRVHSEGIAADHLRAEEFDPGAIAGGWSLAGEGAVAGEEREVLGDVDVDGAVVAPRVIGEALAGLDVVAGDEVGVGVPGIGPLIPDGLAVRSPELVAPDLHVHGAFVDEGVVSAVGVDHPDAVDILPYALVAVHEEAGLGGRETRLAGLRASGAPGGFTQLLPQGPWRGAAKCRHA